jgi:hypothetical protein
MLRGEIETGGAKCEGKEWRRSLERPDEKLFHSGSLD